MRMLPLPLRIIRQRNRLYGLGKAFFLIGALGSDHHSNGIVMPVTTHVGDLAFRPAARIAAAVERTSAGVSGVCRGCGGAVMGISSSPLLWAPALTMAAAVSAT